MLQNEHFLNVCYYIIGRARSASRTRRSGNDRESAGEEGMGEDPTCSERHGAAEEEAAHDGRHGDEGVGFQGARN